MHNDRYGNTSRNKIKIQKFLYRDTTNVEHEMCDYTAKESPAH
jgi:hypothetical protein